MKWKEFNRRKIKTTEKKIKMTRKGEWKEKKGKQKLISLE